MGAPVTDKSEYRHFITYRRERKPRRCTHLCRVNSKSPVESSCPCTDSHPTGFLSCPHCDEVLVVIAEPNRPLCEHARQVLESIRDEGGTGD